LAGLLRNCEYDGQVHEVLYDYDGGGEMRIKCPTKQTKKSTIKLRMAFGMGGRQMRHADAAKRMGGRFLLRSGAVIGVKMKDN
jgi:hypothetical protein